MPDIDWRTGKPIPTRAEWEQLGRWRRLRDVLLGWQPPKDDRRLPRRPGVQAPGD